MNISSGMLMRLVFDLYSGCDKMGCTSSQPGHVIDTSNAIIRIENIYIGIDNAKDEVRLKALTHKAPPIICC